MTTKHAPGPWKFRSIPGHLFEVNDVDGEPVFRVRGGMMPTLADAHLITAAPDLLAALETIASDPDACTCDAQSWYGDGHATLCPQTITRAAIARAKGGQ